MYPENTRENNSERPGNLHWSCGGRELATYPQESRIRWPLENQMSPVGPISLIHLRSSGSASILAGTGRRTARPVEVTSLTLAPPLRRAWYSLAGAKRASEGCACSSSHFFSIKHSRVLVRKMSPFLRAIASNRQDHKSSRAMCVKLSSFESRVLETRRGGKPEVVFLSTFF